MQAKLAPGEDDYVAVDPKDADDYRAENVFWVPTKARWAHLQANAKEPTTPIA